MLKFVWDAVLSLSIRAVFTITLFAGVNWLVWSIGARLGGSAPEPPPGALPLDPGFFPSAERGTPDPETEDLTLIVAGT